MPDDDRKWLERLFENAPEATICIAGVFTYLQRTSKFYGNRQTKARVYCNFITEQINEIS